MKRGGRGGRRGRGGRGGPRGGNQPARNFDQRSYVPNEIQNIDNQLQLLKQKKELMQEHHNMLEFAQYYDPQSYYAQATYETPGPSWSNRDNFYQDEFSGSADYIPLSRGKKRPRPREPSEWSSNKFDSETSSVTQTFGSRLGPKPSVPRAHRETHRQEPATKRSRPDFNPGQNQPNVPNVGDKKAGGAETLPIDLEAHTLRANKAPSTALNGLLELGLGFVLKQMKTNYAESNQYKGMVTRVYYLRKLKKILRDRIKSIMMDKYIPNYVYVVDQYRAKYPIASDETLLKQIKEGIQTDSVETVEDCKPNIKAARYSQAFFRKNIRKIANATLTAMFQKIVDMHETDNFEPEIVHIDPLKVETKPDVNDKKKVQQKPSKWNIDLAEVIEKRFFSRFGKYLPVISRLLNRERNFTKAQAELLAVAMKRDPTMPSAIKDNIKEQQITEVVAEEAEQLQYTATVRGVPKLPPQNLMRPFLNSHKPKHIKTHKKMKELLIVKFSDKESYDNFLKQHGTTIGESTLEIKVSSILVRNPYIPKNCTTDMDNKSGDQSLNDTNESLISSDMDNQITNLLQTIRQAEENAVKEAEVNESTSDKTNNGESGTEQQNSASKANDKQDEVIQENGENKVVTDNGSKELQSEIK